MQDLAVKCGPVFSLRFGSCPVLAISSATAAEECFTKNDIILANRPRLLLGKHMEYNYTTMGSAPYGPLWRNLRHVTTLELFSATNSHESRNEVEVTRALLQHHHEDCCRQVIYFGAKVEDLEEAKQFRDIILKTFELAGASNPGDLCHSFNGLISGASRRGC